MASLATRYRDGEFEAVWRELDRNWLSGMGKFDPDYTRPPTGEEIENIMRQTFDRVARNTDG